ncbi:MAG: hypothetical protein AAF790_01930 [Planctomycetota bacterium]
MSRNLLPALLVCLACVPAAHAVDITVATADFDRWVYPFNQTPGTRTTASTFAAFTPGAFDDRDAQMLVGFNPASYSQPLPTLLPGQSYRVLEATVTATTIGVGSFTYDPTYDSFTTYGPGATETDSDAGRPVTLTGAGLRSPFIGFSFNPGGPPFYTEGGAFAFGDPTAEGVRLTFAADASGTDVSNNVTDGFDFTPFAVGQTSLTPGDTVLAGTTLEFEIDVTDAAIQAYLVDGLDSGLFFTLSSLHSASFGGAPTFPAFATRENTGVGAVAPSLSFTVVAVPEPAAAAVAVIAVVGLAARRRRGSADA